MNSIGMLNYLTVLTKEIGESKNSRLFLENAYSSLINNTYPNAVDEDTLFQLRDILDNLEAFRMTEVKRERLEYVYEQNKAQALRDAIPNPLGLLSAVKSFNLVSLVSSVVYMAVDSATSYASGNAQADMQYLQDGWALDDQEAQTLHNLRSNAFTYMVTMVNMYNLPGDLALNEESVSRFVAWENEGNTVRRIQLLEENKSTYEAYGAYWLLLARSYYDVGRYADCIKAIDSYEKLSTRIFRRDYELAEVLPIVIIAADQVYDGNDYVEAVTHYPNALLDNSAIDDWSSHYFAAQAYIDLYNRTQNQTYLSNAYDLALSNVTHLVSDQRKLNETYMADVITTAIPKGTSDQQKKEIESYNKLVTEERKTAVPPVSNALVLNCDLLFALADTINVSDAERTKIDDILHYGSSRLFLTEPLDDLYWFVNPYEGTNATDINVSFTNEAFVVPASFVTEDTSIKATVVGHEGTDEFSDFAITKVDRKDKEDTDSFAVTFASPTLKDFKMQKGYAITIEVTPHGSEGIQTHSFEFAVEETTTLGIFHGISYVRTK